MELKYSSLFDITQTLERQPSCLNALSNATAVVNHSKASNILTSTGNLSTDSQEGITAGLKIWKSSNINNLHLTTSPNEADAYSSQLLEDQSSESVPIANLTSSNMLSVVFLK